MTAVTIEDLNNAQLDCQTIAEVATSLEDTAVDRLGHTKLTLQGALNTLTALNPRGDWVTATAYARKDLFTSAGITYVAVVDHTSTSIAADLAAGKIALYQGVLTTTTDEFTAPGDFTPGTTTVLTLSRAPGSKDNMRVMFGSAYQGPNQFSLSGTTLTFTAPIPVGVEEVFVEIGVTLATLTPPPGTVDDDVLAWGESLSKQVASIADLLALDPTRFKRARTAGYYGLGTKGWGDYYVDQADTTTPGNGGTVHVGMGGARWKLIQEATAERFGCYVDGNGLGAGHNDTARFHAYLDFLNNTFGKGKAGPGYMNLDYVLFTGLNYDFDFDNTTLYGVATTPQDAFVTMQDFATHQVRGLHIETDGNVATPVFHGNYACALRLISTSGGPNPTQFVTMDDLEIRYFRDGIVNGNYVGTSPQPDAAQSEIFINNYRTRGVMRPFFGNLINSYIVFTRSTLLAQQFEASSSWWSDADGWIVRNDDARSEVQFDNCEFQRAIQPGYAVYGVGIVINDPVWEVSSPSLLAGDFKFRGGINNFFGVSGIEPFQVPSFANGVIRFEDFKLERPAGTANFDETVLINAAGNNSIQIHIDGRFMEWQFDNPNGVGDFIRGGQVTINDLFIDNSTGTHASFKLNAPGNTLNNVDRTGTTFPVGGVTTPEGGWTVTAGSTHGAYAQNTASPPPGAACWLYAETDSVGGFTFESSGSDRAPIHGGRDAMLEMWLRVFGFGAGASWQAIIEWRDYAGTTIATNQVASLTTTTNGPWATPNGMKLRAGVKVPWQATSYILRFTLGANTSIGINDVTVLQ